MQNKETVKEIRETVLRGMREECDDANFHVVGDNWRNLNDLVDRPGSFGSLGAWVVFFAADVAGLPTDGREGYVVDSYDALAHRLDTLACEYLGIDREEWDEFEHLTLGHALAKLETIVARDE